MNSLHEASVAEVIDKCVDMKTQDSMLLNSATLYVYDNQLEQECEVLAAMTGATLFDKLVPFLTTHIVCKQETQQLRAALGRMYSLNMAGSSSNKNALTTDLCSV